MERVQTHKTYGAITGLVVVVVTAILQVANLSLDDTLNWLPYIPFLVGLILNARAYSKANDGYITYGQAFSSCFKATAVITLIVLVWTLLSATLIFPDMKEQALEQVQMEMEKESTPDEAKDMAMEVTRKGFVPFLIAGVVFGYMFFGAIFSLIAAAVAKRRTGGAPPQMDVMGNS